MSLTTGKRIASVSVGSISNGNGSNGKQARKATTTRVATRSTTIAPVLTDATATVSVLEGARVSDQVSTAESTKASTAANLSAAKLSAAKLSATATVKDGEPPCLASPMRMSIATARPGEQVIARQLLASMLRGPSHAEFQAQLDDPFFEPTDRLFCRINELLVGHVRLVKREMRYGSAVIPVTILADLMILPECRRQGCGAALLAECERETAADGAVLGMLRTNQPNFFLRRGWCVWTRHSFSVAGAREILSRLLESRQEGGCHGDPSPQHYNIRLWRHIEQAALVQLYDGRASTAWGPFVRTESYWQWLLGRHAYDRIYVALDGPDRMDLDAASPIVGYAVMKDGRILELMTSPGHPDAGPQLLARACADAIEQDIHYVRLDAPVGDPLHHVVARAGGELGYHEALHGEVCLVKLLDVPRGIELLSQQLIQRAKDAGIPLPIDLGLQVGCEKYTLEIRARSVKLKNGRSCRSYLECSQGELTQLLLGHLDVNVAIAAQRVAASTRVAAEIASSLFPRVPLWRPPWDELPAS